ncbi:MAG: glycosyltransferase, partial [Clostridia bacterium]|nr:glycosyltransferase [Clostridia bacterium]
LDIFAEVKRRKENAVLLLVGDGDLRAEMEQKAKTLGIADSVIFTGVRSDVPDLLQAMDVFVFPSLYEGLPVTLVEAQAAGLPCCVSTGVPAETAVTELVQFRPLEDGADQWAQWGLSRVTEARRDTLEAIQKAGYDISSTSVWLENFYRNVVENHE